MSNQIINFKINNKALTIVTHDGIKNIQFTFEIKQVEKFDNYLVVRVAVPKGTVFNENIFGISSEGEVVWQIEHLRYVYKDSPFVGMESVGDNIKLFNWDGTDLLVNPETGKIIQQGYSK